MSKYLPVFCEYENEHFSCRRDWCGFTCPVARYARWLECGRRSKWGYTKILYEEIPDDVRKAIMSEELGEDVDVVAGKVKYLRNRAVEKGLEKECDEMMFSTGPDWGKEEDNDE